MDIRFYFIDHGVVKVRGRKSMLTLEELSGDQNVVNQINEAVEKAKEAGLKKAYVYVSNTRIALYLTVAKAYVNPLKVYEDVAKRELGSLMFGSIFRTR